MKDWKSGLVLLSLAIGSMSSLHAAPVPFPKAASSANVTVEEQVVLCADVTSLDGVIATVNVPITFFVGGRTETVMADEDGHASTAAMVSIPYGQMAVASASYGSQTEWWTLQANGPQNPPCAQFGN